MKEKGRDWLIEQNIVLLLSRLNIRIDAGHREIRDKMGKPMLD
jgi:hypothetical protein